jgi:integrase
MKRRGNREGSIYRDPRGFWRAAAFLGHRNGRLWRRYFSGQTREEAARKLYTFLRGRHFGTTRSGEKADSTVEAYLGFWLEQAATRLRPKTISSYRFLAEKHIIPLLGPRPLQRLEPHHVADLLREKTGSGLSPRTVAYIRVVLRAALQDAMRMGTVDRNVAALVRPPRVPSSEMNPLTPEEVQKFLSAAKHTCLRPLFILALATGLRQGELLGLKWQDLDAVHRTLTVRRALQVVEGKLNLVDVKTRQSRRQIALPAIALAGLGKPGKPNDLIFTTATGNPIYPRNVLRAFYATLDNAGLPRRSFHTLRHCCATFLLSKGIHPRVVMEILGHSSIRVTMDVYSHVLPAQHQQAAKRIDGLLRAAGVQQMKPGKIGKDRTVSRAG